MNRNLIQTSSPFLDLAKRFFDTDFNYPLFENRYNGLSNVLENENEYLIELSTPGFKKEDIKIELENDVLTISSEVEDKKEENGDGYHRREFYKSSFARSFTIPKNVNKNKISANMNDGILVIEIPKFVDEKKNEKLKITVK